MATTKSTHHDVPHHYSAYHLPIRQMPKPPLGLRPMPPPPMPWPARMMPDPAAMYHHMPAPFPAYPPPEPIPHIQPLPQRDDWQGIGFNMSTASRAKRPRPEEDPKPIIKADATAVAPPPVADSYDQSPTSSSASTKAPPSYDSLTSFSEFDDPGFALFRDTPAGTDPSVVEQESLWGIEGLPELPATEPDYNDEPLLTSHHSAPFDTETTPPAAVSQSRPLEHDDLSSQDAASSSSSRGRASKYMRKSAAELEDSNSFIHRPALNESHLKELNDLSMFRNNDEYKSMIVDYHEGISFALGEGGRELLRACLNVKGCKGRQLQGASVPALLSLAKQWNLWDVAIRIKCERSTGKYCAFHDKFVKFKANQSAQRKNVKKEYMKPERDQNQRLTNIIYDENRKITLGKEGREQLRAQLRRLHDKHPTRMDEQLHAAGLKYSELRNATVQQLSRMAKVCNMWDQVVLSVRLQEEMRDSKKGKLMSPMSRPEQETESETSEAPPHLEEELDPSQLVADDLQQQQQEESQEDLLLPPPDDYHHLTPQVKTEAPPPVENATEDFYQQYAPSEDSMFQAFMENSFQPVEEPVDSFHPWPAFDQ